MSIPAKDMAAIHLMRTTFWAVTKAFGAGYAVFAKAYPEIKIKGEAELARLRACKTAAKLEEALADYYYHADIVRHSAPPWATTYRKFGDCNDACMLIDSIRPGGDIYAIVRIEDGEPKDYDKWHFVYVEGEVVWSNFEFYFITPHGFPYWVKHYWKKANYIVRLDKDFNLKGVEEI